MQRKYEWRSVRLAPNLRLYNVQVRFPEKPTFNGDSVVAASSPKEAEQRMRDLYSEASYMGTGTFTGRLLRVYQEIKEKDNATTR